MNNEAIAQQAFLRAAARNPEVLDMLEKEIAKENANTAKKSSGWLGGSFMGSTRYTNGDVLTIAGTALATATVAAVAGYAIGKVLQGVFTDDEAVSGLAPMTL